MFIAQKIFAILCLMLFLIIIWTHWVFITVINGGYRERSFATSHLCIPALYFFNILAKFSNAIILIVSLLPRISVFPTYLRESWWLFLEHKINMSLTYSQFFPVFFKLSYYSLLSLRTVIYPVYAIFLGFYKTQFSAMDWLIHFNNKILDSLFIFGFGFFSLMAYQLFVGYLMPKPFS